MPASLTIGQLAANAGVGVETVRFYERSGLLPDPPRTTSGYRQYGTSTVDRVKFIRRCKQLGFSLPEIQDLLDLRFERQSQCAEVKDQIAARLVDVGDRIRDLQRVERSLRVLLERCDSADPQGACPTLEALWAQE